MFSSERTVCTLESWTYVGLRVADGLHLCLRRKTSPTEGVSTMLDLNGEWEVLRHIAAKSVIPAGLQAILVHNLLHYLELVL